MCSCDFVKNMVPGFRTSSNRRLAVKRCNGRTIQKNGVKEKWKVKKKYEKMAKYVIL